MVGKYPEVFFRGFHSNKEVFNKSHLLPLNKTFFLFCSEYSVLTRSTFQPVKWLTQTVNHRRWGGGEQLKTLSLKYSAEVHDHCLFISWKITFPELSVTFRYVGYLKSYPWFYNVFYQRKKQPEILLLQMQAHRITIFAPFEVCLLFKEKSPDFKQVPAVSTT